jgi:flavin-dependent dehydrogenase
MAPIPSHTKVLIIGGGPAGSYSAALLAQEGVEVTLLEATQFPRYHIGESLLPYVGNQLKFIDLYDKVRDHGFQVKLGACVKLNKYKKEGYTNFVHPDPTKFSWNVVRSEFDEMIMRRAQELGAQVYENTRVTAIEFEEGADDKPISVSWTRKNGTERETGTTSFDWLIDASGRAGLMSTKYHKDRIMNPGFKNNAVWGYWRGGNKYAPGSDRENVPFFEAMTDESGWVWYIPLHDGTVSIGVVMNEDASNALRKTRSSLMEHYLAQLELVPAIKELKGNAVFDEKKISPALQIATDYSYFSVKHAGENYRIIGDAGAFIDPFFSSGLHLSMAGALSAAATICGVMRDGFDPTAAAEFHTEKVRIGYTRFVFVVVGVYKAIHNQKETETVGTDETLDIIRPVIQATASVSNDELKDIMGYVHTMFAENHDRSGAVNKLKEKDTGGRSKVWDNFVSSINNADNDIADVIDNKYIRMTKGSLGIQST